MASTVTVTVPAPHGDAVVAALLALYRAETEALSAATSALLDDRGSPLPVLEHRGELAELDGMLELVDWRFGPRDEPLELVGPPRLVREVVRASVIRAAEALARDVERYERGKLELAELRSSFCATSALFRAFAELEQG